MVECLKLVVLVFVGILDCSLSQGPGCPFGCTCTVNESNDGTDVICSGHLDSHLSFHLLNSKVISIRITDYDVLQLLDLRDQSISDISKVQVSDGSIKHLELSFNHITTAALSQFNHLSKLSSINLSNNNMVRFDTSNVRASNTLMEINLEENNLTDVHLDTADFTRTNFPNLTIILYDNPLYCSCPADNNALVLFTPDNTPCVTQEGRSSTLDEGCNINTGVNIGNEDDFSTNMGTGSSTGHPDDDFTTPPPPVQNVSYSSSSQSRTRFLPLFPTPVSTTSTVRVVVQPTSTQDSSQQTAEHVTLIIGSSVATIIAILTIILFVLVSIVCKRKRRFIPLETDEGQMPVSYLSPIKIQDSLRGQHYITESTMRLSQLAQPDPYYEEVDRVTNGLGPAPLPPHPAPVNINQHVVVPYHVSEIQVSSDVQLTPGDQNTTTIEDDVCPPAANQYLDIHP